MQQAECGFHQKPNGFDLLIVQGPTILVDIGFDPAFDPAKLGSVPVPAVQNISALVDTGAIVSFIDASLATVLKLPIVDKTTVSGSIGAHPADVYLAQMRVPALDINIYGQFAGVNLIAGGFVHSAVLGRTFLRILNMSYDGATGRVLLVKP
jgi:hypothetical protein